MRFRRMAAALAVSTALHGAIGGSVIEYKHRPLRNRLAGWMERYEQYRIQQERKKLVQEAIEQRKQGQLQLGEFILRANYLDAKEEGKPFDLEKARRLYQGYWGQVYELLRSGNPVRQTIASVFGHMNYHGVPGGRMAEALLEGGGSCAQIPHALVAVLYDSGYRDQAFLRFYGQNKKGLAHLAAIFLQEGQEYDLSTGGTTYARGVRFRADELIEMYAHAHGLMPAAAQGAGSVTVFPDQQYDRLARGGKAEGFSYPFTTESYPGSAPLFGSRAVLEPGQAEESNAADGAAGHAEDGRMIIFPGRLGPGLSDFDRPRYMPPEGYSLITVDDLHDEKELEKLSMDIEGSENELRALELQGTDFVADILAQLGRLAWLYGKAREVSAFLGKQELSDEAERRRMATIKEAERIIDAIDWKGKGQLVLDDLVMLMAPWEPMFLGPKGEEVVFRIAEEVLFTSDVLEREVWAALVLAPSTRARAAAMLAEKDKVLQQWIIYMLRKQGINDLEGEEEFCRAYRADSHVNGWYERRLRNGGIEGFVGQLSEFVQQETARHGLDKEWRFALAKEYVTKFTVRLLRMRGTARNPRQPPPIVVP